MKTQNGTLESNFKNVVEILESAASSVDDKVSGAKKTVAKGVTSFAAKAGETIKNHPIAAIGIALGVGYLVMRMIRR